MNSTNPTHFQGGILSVGAWLRRRPMIPALLSGAAIFWFFGAAPGSGQPGEAGRANRDGSTIAVKHFWTAYHGKQLRRNPGSSG